jgi:hypothetical protein
VHAPHRTRLFPIVLLAFAVLASGCSAGSGSSDGASRPSGAGSSTRTSEGNGKPKPKFVPYATPPGTKVAVRPDGFVVTKTPAGQKPPQFVVVSFDGAGWHKKWQFWRDLQAQVPFHFTGFLSGTYLLSEATKVHYVGPGHAPGKSSLAWTQPGDVPVVIGDVNEALSRGDEIGTHFNGHFCSGAEPSVGKWSTADWNNELDQFFSLIQNVDTNNGIEDKLDLKASDITGARTPCLEGHPDAMFPAYTAHHMVYDSSETRNGVFWPVQSPTQHVWQIGMARFPMHGPDRRPLITMDYNFYFRQRKADSHGVSPDQSAQDSAVVLGTYQDMYRTAFAGNRAPLILGNHFEEWNNGAYQSALASFVHETCGKKGTYCVSFADLIAWMQAQDPAALAQLQALPPEMTPTP